MRAPDVAVRRAFVIAAVASCALCSSIAAGQPNTQAARVWPTLVPTLAAAPSLRPPTDADGALRDRAKEIDSLLADAAQDLGLTLRVGAPLPASARVVRDSDVAEEAKVSNAWVISPRVERDGGALVVRLMAAPPGSKIVLVREEHVTPESLAVRVVVMLRDIVDAWQHGNVASEPSRRATEREDHVESKSVARSPGRPILAVSTAAFGGYVGYALQRTSRSDDPRLLYPLMAIGTGVGLGASMIVADEWDVGVGDAWYMTAGTWWPTTSALLLAAGYDVQPATDRPAYGLLAGIAGTGIASIALSQKGIGEGSALLAHSGGALGTFLGAMTELAIRGTTGVTPYKGLGYGAGAGVLVAGVLATQVDVSSSRMLLVDMGAAIGALAGAAAASPLLLKNETEQRERAWLILTMSGTAVGTGVALWATRGETARKSGSVSVPLPSPGIIALSPAPTGRWAPVPGVSWSGDF